MNLLLVLVCLSTLAFAKASFDDCESNCPDSGWFPARCRQNESLDTHCSEITEVYDFSENDSLWGKMLDLHNNFRNKVAGGDLKGFSKTTNMATLSWSEELANSAYQNVKDCLYETNPCHNMEKGKKYGQTAVQMNFNKGEWMPSQSEAIDMAFGFWEDTCQLIQNPNAVMKSNPNEYSFSRCLTMAKENYNKIGCSSGMVSEAIGDSQMWWVLCNYDEEIQGPEVASGCGSVNSDYTNLCSLD